MDHILQGLDRGAAIALGPNHRTGIGTGTRDGSGGHRGRPSPMASRSCWNLHLLEVLVSQASQDFPQQVPVTLLNLNTTRLDRDIEFAGPGSVKGISE